MMHFFAPLHITLVRTEWLADGSTSKYPSLRNVATAMRHSYAPFANIGLIDCHMVERRVPVFSQLCHHGTYVANV